MDLMSKSLTGLVLDQDVPAGETSEKGHVRAVVCTYGVKDKDGDVVMKGAIPEGSPVILSAYNHSAMTAHTMPVGKGVINTVGNEAILEGEFFMDTAAGRDAFRTVKSLAKSGLGEWSWGFQVLDQQEGEYEGKSANFINKTYTFEASFVAMGAGVNTRTLEAKTTKVDLPEGKKFADEGAAVLAAVKSYRSRAEDVLAYRREKGKALSEDTIKLVKELATEVSDLLDTLTDPQEASEASADNNDEQEQDEESVAVFNDDETLEAELLAFLLNDISGDNNE